MSAKKAGRQSIKRSRRNGSARTATKTAVNKALRSLAVSDMGVAQPAVEDAISILDRAVRKGVMHKNTAARRKSRISARINRIQAAS